MNKQALGNTERGISVNQSHGHNLFSHYLINLQFNSLECLLVALNMSETSDHDRRFAM